MSDRTAADAGGRPAVLVVDDDDAIRGVVRTVLEADGFQVVEAADGPAALLLLDSINGRGPELVVLDIMMPGIDGIEVCRRIDRERAEAAGADAYISKPFSAIDLLDVVEGLSA